MSKNKLITANDVQNWDVDFASDKDRIKYMSQNYSRMGIAKAFGVYYNTNISVETKTDRNINSVTVIEVGGIYTGSVKEIGKDGTITFYIPGVKEELIAKENFNSCRDAIDNYLLTHDNKLDFEVREKRNGKFYVSVINAYYRSWQNIINRAIANEDAIKVHIDELVKGGYICHTNIAPLVELTGKEYTSSVFIPGSHIVLNIERNFEQWIGEDVMIIPQKFVDFKTDPKTGTVEKSLVGSRKRVLQVLGMLNIYEIYNDIETKKKLAEISSTAVEVVSDAYEGTVTGIINSNKKQGAFVELTDKYITGLLPLDAGLLLDYKPGDPIRVRIKEFEVQDGKEPFILNKRKQIVRANVRPVFELA